MAREIKFRAWERPDKHRFVKKEDWFSWAMHYDIMFYLPRWIDNPDYEIMQYTWLKDKNWKEIFEGDIITVISKNEFKIWWDSNKLFEVVWDWCCYSFNNWRTLFHFLEKDWYETTVIWNRFENPELLSN